MNITYAQLEQLDMVLTTLSQRELSTVALMTVSQLILKTRTDTGLLYEKRGEIYQKYGSDKGNGRYTINEENVASANEELTALYGLQMELPPFKPLTLDDVGAMKPQTAVRAPFLFEWLQEEGNQL